MSGFLYFKAGDGRALTKDAVAKLRLGYAFDAGIQCVEVNNNSPSGAKGVVFADPARHSQARIGYFRDQQTWRQMPAVEGRPELWVGYWTDTPPTPSVLQRNQLLRGPKIKLADGNAWQIPIVRHFDDELGLWQSDLPALLDIDADGKLTKGRTLQKYQALWDATAPLADARFMQDSGEVASEITEENVVDAVVALLQANYVVGLPELIAAGVLQESDLAMVALVSCRYERLLHWIDTVQKKTDAPSTPSGEITSDGAAA